MFQFPDGSRKYIFQHRSKSLNSDQPEMVYEESIEKDFDSIKGWLPEESLEGAILDIGCGLGGIDIPLAMNYPRDKFYLMDGSGWAERRVGFNVRMEAFNDLLLTEKMIKLNLIEEISNNFSFIDYKKYKDERIEKCKLIFSLFSWGFHYPVQTYLDFAINHLVKGGKLILDVRDNQQELFILNRDQRIRKNNREVRIPINETRKGLRVCYEKI